MQTFFAPVARCFDPVGSCAQAIGANGVSITCWKNGTRLVHMNVGMDDNYTEYISSSGETCLTWHEHMGLGEFTAGATMIQYVLGYICGGQTPGCPGLGDCCDDLYALVMPDEQSCPPGTCP